MAYKYFSIALLVGMAFASGTVQAAEKDLGRFGATMTAKKFARRLRKKVVWKKRPKRIGLADLLDSLEVPVKSELPIIEEHRGDHAARGDMHSVHLKLSVNDESTVSDDHKGASYAKLMAPEIVGGRIHSRDELEHIIAETYRAQAVAQSPATAPSSLAAGGEAASVSTSLAPEGPLIHVHRPMIGARRHRPAAAQPFTLHPELVQREAFFSEKHESDPFVAELMMRQMWMKPWDPANDPLANKAAGNKS